MSPGRFRIDQRTAALCAVFTSATAALVAALSTIGEPDAAAPAITSLYLLIAAGLPPALYILGGIGLGRLFAPLTRGAGDAAALRCALGLALLLTLSHALGCMGLLAGLPGRIIATTVCLIGLALLLLDLRRAQFTVPPALFLILPGLALLLIAALQPPGWLWASEFGGFDALSYHLQLPQEWLARGRIEPLEHNVYSYLPGYVEAAFAHIAAIIGAPAPRPGGAVHGLLAGDGVGALSCQLLHVGIAITAAWLIARCVRLASGDPAQSTTAAWIAGALFLATPWIIVVGSLAYNDLGVVALGAGGFAAALDRGLTPARRGCIAGILVGVACGCKPTALPFLGAPLAILLLGLNEPRRWIPMVSAGCAAGLVALAPWLLRNTLYGGNPVFPYLTGVFGDAHWTPDQAERFTRATFFQGSLPHRLALLVAPDTHDPAGARHRGVFHPQWFLFFPIAGASALAVIAAPSTRRIGLLLTGGLMAQAVAWLYASHLQSRFLLPLTIPSALLLGTAIPTLVGAASPRGKWLGRSALALPATAIAIQAAASVWNFTWQNRARPNQLLVPGPGVLSGALFDSWTQAEAAGLTTPEPFLNLALPPGRTVYLLGDATPLYTAPPVIYNTVWDRSPLAGAIRSHPGQPERWGEALRQADVRYVLVNLAELDRYRRSGYIDPVLTPEAVDRFLASCGRLVREFPRGRALFELTPIEARP